MPEDIVKSFKYSMDLLKKINPVLQLVSLGIFLGVMYQINVNKFDHIDKRLGHLEHAQQVSTADHDLLIRIDQNVQNNTIRLKEALQTP